jgi:hypothetical protein
MPAPLDVLVNSSGGTTIHTLPAVGQSVMATSLPMAIASDQPPVPILGRSTVTAITPVVTSNGVYAAGNIIGGLMTFPTGGIGSGTLMSLSATSRSVLSTALKAYVFIANPAASTWTDRTAPAINVADIASLLGIFTLSGQDSGLGTCTVWNLPGIGVQFAAANLYVIAVPVAGVTLTSASTSDFTMRLGVALD